MTDINECLGDDHECHIDAHCINLNGSYDCLCKEGYSGDGFDCKSEHENYSIYIYHVMIVMNNITDYLVELKGSQFIIQIL